MKAIAIVAALLLAACTHPKYPEAGTVGPLTWLAATSGQTFHPSTHQPRCCYYYAPSYR